MVYCFTNIMLHHHFPSVHFVGYTMVYPNLQTCRHMVTATTLKVSIKWWWTTSASAFPNVAALRGLFPNLPFDVPYWEMIIHLIGLGVYFL